MAWVAGFDSSKQCVRCNLNEVDSVGHRLWRCPENAPFTDWLNEQIGDYVIDLDALPRCLTRCGIDICGSTVPTHVVMAIQQYLVMLNNHANQCYANFKKDLAFPEASLDLEAFQVAHSRLRSLAIKPLSKQQGTCVNAQASLEDYSPINPEVHFDGPYTHDTDTVDAKAGFGVAVKVPGSSDGQRFSSPVVTNRQDPTFRGAPQLSNNSAELQGAILALEVASTLPPGVVVIGYDSEYARRTITGEWRSRHNVVP